MSLLADFILAINENWVTMLHPTSLRGKEKEVMDLFLQQRKNGQVDKTAVQQQLGLSNSHFDKICSILLDKCYERIAPNGDLSLLAMLGSKVPALERHFFKEAAKQVEVHKTDGEYLCCVLELMQNNLPIANQDFKFIRLVSKYIHQSALHNQIESLKVYTSAKELYLRIAVDFSARKIEENKHIHETTLMALELHFDNIQPLAQAELLRTRVYYHFACMQMEACIKPALLALNIYRHGKFVFAEENYQRMQLRLAEVYYLQSNFREALTTFREAFKLEKTVPDRGYYNTKYIQLCLIEGEKYEARSRFEEQIKNLASKQLYSIRDIISGIKVYLFTGELDKVYEYLLLGFAVQTKTRYTQYEIELRNLEVAYFYLNNNLAVAYQLCERNVKYLHKNGFNIKKSRYPEFFLLTKSFIRKNKLTPRRISMLQDWQTEGYALYGRLLKLMFGL